MLRGEGLIHLLACGGCVPSTIGWKDPSPIGFPGQCSWKSGDHKCKHLFMNFNFYSINLYVFPVLIAMITAALEQVSKSDGINAPILFFFTIVFDIVRPLHFQVNFMVSLPILTLPPPPPLTSVCWSGAQSPCWTHVLAALNYKHSFPQNRAFTY